MGISPCNCAKAAAKASHQMIRTMSNSSLKNRDKNNILTIAKWSLGWEMNLEETQKLKAQVLSQLLKENDMIQDLTLIHTH